MTALVGDNGAGKSSLIKTVAGLWAPDAGRIRWQGKPVTLRNPKDAEQLGITTIYQDLALCDNLDIVQNMFLGHELLRHGILDESSMEIAARDTLRELAVTTVRSIRQPVASLSGGQRQSVAVAKAVMAKARLVIMDEPTAALGVSQTEQVLDLIRRLADQGVAVLMVSHNLNDVFRRRRPDRRPLPRPAGRRRAGSRLRPAVGRRVHDGRRPLPAGGELTVAGDEQDPRRPTPGRPTMRPRRRPWPMPEVVADSLGEYLRAWWTRIKGGDSGVLPILAGLAIIIMIFQVQEPVFLSAGNIVNLLTQAAVFVLLGLAEIFALVLSEIDLSTGFVAAVGGMIIAELLASPNNWPWWSAILAGLAATAAIGALQGTLITRLRLPSFIVTLAGLLGWEGVLIWLADIDKGAVGGVVRITDPVVYNLVNGNMSPLAGWVTLVVVVGLYAVVTVTRTVRRRRQGLSAPPLSITVATIARRRRRRRRPRRRLQRQPWRRWSPSRASRGSFRSSSRSSWPGPGCSPARGPAGTCTPSAPTRRRPGGPGSTSPGSGRSAS